MRYRVRSSTRKLGAVALSRTSNSSKTTSPDNHLESFFCRKFFYRSCWDWVSHSASSNSRECDGGVDTMPTQLHADTHFSRTRSTMHASHIFMWAKCDKRSAFFWFIFRHVFALPSSFTSSLPDYFVLTTSIYFSTFSVLHVRSTAPVSIHKRTRSLEGVWPTGRLVVSTDRRMMRDSRAQGNLLQIHSHQYMQKVFQNVQKKLGRSPIHATFSVESYKTNVSTWRLLWHRRWKLL